MDTPKLRSILESLLLSTGEPLKPKEIAEMVDCRPDQIVDLFDQLQAEYESAGRGFRVVNVAGGYQLRTSEENGVWVRQLMRGRPFKFSRASLETLAIIAYRQPVTRAEIESLRGVDSGGVLRTLLEKQLIRIQGKKEVPGKPIIYGTTSQFLELFGLKDLAALPPLKEVGALTAEEEPLFESGFEAPHV